MSWEWVALILGCIWALVGIIWIAGWLSTYDKDDLLKDQMAYNISDERLLELLITDPTWCLFYHRERVKQLLPTLVKSHMLVEGVRAEINEQLKVSEGARDGPSR